MVNIWDYVDAKTIRITDIDGEKFTGDVVSVFDGGETVDGEDEITIDCGGVYIGFKPGEILRIDRIERIVREGSMKDLVPEDYFGKKLKVYTCDGTVIVGTLYGYSFDYDDDGKEYMELDFEVPYSNILTGYRDDEIEKIVIIGKSDR